MVEGKKVSLLQRALIEFGRYAALAGISSGVSGCFCSDYVSLPKDVTTQKYLWEKEMPFNYAAELDCKCREYSKQGKILEDLVTRLGWGFAVVNGSGKIIASSGLGAVAGEKGKNFAFYALDGTYGGRTFDEAIGKILQGELGESVKAAYDAEDTKLGGHGKIIIIGSSIAAPIVLPLTLADGHHGGAPTGPGPTPSDPF